MRSLVILSGPVGAGKSTIARKLVALSPGGVVLIEGDTFWSFIAKIDAGKSIDKNFRTIMASMTAASVPFAMADFEVILDFSVPPWFLASALRIVKRREIPLDYVVLRPSETVCAARAAERTEGRITDYTQYHELYMSFDDAERYTICDDNGEAATIAAQIRAGLDAGLFRVPQ